MKSGLHSYISRDVLPLDKITLILSKDHRRLLFSCLILSSLGGTPDTIHQKNASNNSSRNVCFLIMTTKKKQEIDMFNTHDF